MYIQYTYVHTCIYTCTHIHTYIYTPYDIHTYIYFKYVNSTDNVQAGLYFGPTVVHKESMPYFTYETDNSLVYFSGWL